jgi:hypothetical protein
MCICINCEFYKTCWIKNGLNKIDPYLNIYSIKGIKRNKNLIINSSIEVHLLMNLFIVSEKLELDVIECSAFCESAGKWFQ